MIEWQVRMWWILAGELTNMDEFQTFSAVIAYSYSVLFVVTVACILINRIKMLPWVWGIVGALSMLFSSFVLGSWFGSWWLDLTLSGIVFVAAVWVGKIVLETPFVKKWTGKKGK